MSRRARRRQVSRFYAVVRLNCSACGKRLGQVTCSAYEFQPIEWALNFSPSQTPEGVEWAACPRCKTRSLRLSRAKAEAAGRAAAGEQKRRHVEYPVGGR